MEFTHSQKKNEERRRHERPEDRQGASQKPARRNSPQSLPKAPYLDNPTTHTYCRSQCRLDLPPFHSPRHCDRSRPTRRPSTWRAAGRRWCRLRWPPIHCRCRRASCRSPPPSHPAAESGARRVPRRTRVNDSSGASLPRGADPRRGPPAPPPRCA